MGQSKMESFEKIHRWTFEIIQKFGQKMKNFEIFFDIIDNHACVHMHIKKNFKIFHFLAKFLNYLKGPPIEFFLNRFFSTSMHGETKFDIDSGWVLTFGLGPLPRELWFSWQKTKLLFKTKRCIFDLWCYLTPKLYFWAFKDARRWQFSVFIKSR